MQWTTKKLIPYQFHPLICSNILNEPGVQHSPFWILYSMALLDLFLLLWCFFFAGAGGSGGGYGGVVDGDATRLIC